MKNVLSDTVLAKIEKETAKYPLRRAAVKSSLRYAQDEHGWISDEVVKSVAQVLGLQPIEVYEIATFYDHFDTRPVGKHRIKVCTNVSCMLCGSDTIVEYLRSKLGISFGETTDDGRFTLYESECLAACCGAPMMMIGNQYYENLTADSLDAILEGLE